MRKKNRIILMLFLLIVVNVAGCQNNIIEEQDYVDTNIVNDIAVDNVKDKNAVQKGDDNEGDKIAQKNFEDIEGWDANKENSQYYIWGTWEVKKAWNGGYWSEDDPQVGATLELLPDYYFYENKTQTFTNELDGWSVSVVAPRWGNREHSLELTGDYCLLIDFTETRYEDDIPPFSYFYFMEQGELLAYSGRALYLLQKICDYTGELENVEFTVSDYGIVGGEWEVTGVLKANQEDDGSYIGQKFSTHVPYTENTEDVYHSVYLLDMEEKSIEKLVEAMELKDEPCVVCYELSEGVNWDKLIIKDEMTVVLVKDNNFYWARRISEIDETGAYGI